MSVLKETNIEKVINGLRVDDEQKIEFLLKSTKRAKKPALYSLFTLLPYNSFQHLLRKDDCIELVDCLSEPANQERFGFLFRAEFLDNTKIFLQSLKNNNLANQISEKGWAGLTQTFIVELGNSDCLKDLDINDVLETIREVRGFDGSTQEMLKSDFRVILDFNDQGIDVLFLIPQTILPNSIFQNAMIDFMKGEGSDQTYFEKIKSLPFVEDDLFYGKIIISKIFEESIHNDKLELLPSTLEAFGDGGISSFEMTQLFLSAFEVLHLQKEGPLSKLSEVLSSQYLKELRVLKDGVPQNINGNLSKEVAALLSVRQVEEDDGLVFVKDSSSIFDEMSIKDMLAVLQGLEKFGGAKHLLGKFDSFNRICTRFELVKAFVGGDQSENMKISEKGKKLISEVLENERAELDRELPDKNQVKRRRELTESFLSAFVSKPPKPGI